MTDRPGIRCHSSTPTWRQGLHRGLLCFLFICMATPAGAWGPGHAYQVTLTLELLPPAITAPWSVEQLKRVKSYASYPDSFEPFDPKIVDPEGMALLAGFRDTLRAPKNRYQLHSERGRVVAWLMLKRAFERGDTEQQCLWVGALTHSIGDMGAVNHGALVQCVTYEIATTDFALYTKTGAALSDMKNLLDLAWLAARPEGMAGLREGVKSYQAPTVPVPAGEVMVELMMASVQGNGLMSQQEVAVARGALAWIDGDEATARKSLFPAMQAVGVWGAKTSAWAITQAYLHARAKTPVALTESVLARFEATQDAYCRAKPLSQEAIYTEGLAGAGKRGVGILLEPSYWMQYGFLGIFAKYPSAAIMRGLREAQVPYMIQDVRVACEQGLADPQVMPVLIVVSGSYASRLGVDRTVWERKLADYVRQGGRLLWVGWEPPGNMAALGLPPKPFTTVEENKLWPLSVEAMQQAPVRFVGDWLRGGDPLIARGKAGLTPTVPLKTKAGWTHPVCRYGIAADAGVIPLAEVVAPTGTPITVAGLFRDATQRPVMVFLPSYLVKPYLYSGVKVVCDVDAQLDPVGHRVLQSALKLLQ